MLKTGCPSVPTPRPCPSVYRGRRGVHMNFLLLFTCLCLVDCDSDVIGSDKPVTVTVGDNVILPCHLEPPFDVRTLTVEWTRDGEYVHISRHGKDYLTDQDENFRGRTSLFHEEMIRGNISLKLTSVTELDAGSYTCNVPKLQSQVRRGFINLIVDSDVIGSDKPVTVTVGDNAILPCHLEPPFDVTTLTVEWKRDGEYVHVYRSRKDDPGSQDKNFRGRTSLFHEEMMRGNISLKLTNVTELDAGSYTCFVSKLQKQVRRGFINLTVEPVENRNKGGQADDTNTESGGDTGLSPGAIIGIVVGVIAVIAIIVFAVWKYGNIRGQGANVVANDEHNDGANDEHNDRASGEHNDGANDVANDGANDVANDEHNDGANDEHNDRASDDHNDGANVVASDEDNDEGIPLLNRNPTTDCATPNTTGRNGTREGSQEDNAEDNEEDIAEHNAEDNTEDNAEH